MSIPLSLPGMHAPAAGFDAPFELLAGCHDRVRRTLALLKRLTDRVERQGADAQAQAAARDVLRYFDIAAPAHHEDEERHVLPLLETSADPALAAAVARLRRDHEVIRAAWQVLRPLLARPGGDGARDGAAARRRQRAYSTSSARKSLTLVKVGPGTTRSPSGSKKL